MRHPIDIKEQRALHFYNFSLLLLYSFMLMLTLGFLCYVAFYYWLFYCWSFGRRKLLTCVRVRAVKDKEFLKENLQIRQYLLLLIPMDFHMLARLDSIMYFASFIIQTLLLLFWCPTCWWKFSGHTWKRTIL